MRYNMTNRSSLYFRNPLFKVQQYRYQQEFSYDMSNVDCPMFTFSKSAQAHFSPLCNNSKTVRRVSSQKALNTLVFSIWFIFIVHLTSKTFDVFIIRLISKNVNLFFLHSSRFQLPQTLQQHHRRTALHVS